MKWDVQILDDLVQSSLFAFKKKKIAVKNPSEILPNYKAKKIICKNKKTSIFPYIVVSSL